MHLFTSRMISSFGSLFILLMIVPAGISRADYLAYMVSFGLLSSSVTSIVNMAKEMIYMKPVIEQLSQLFDYQKASEKGTEYVKKLKGDIQVRDLSFSYKDGAANCIFKLNMHIHPGEILYDGKPINTLYKRSLRKAIGSVFQFSMVFPVH